MNRRLSYAISGVGCLIVLLVSVLGCQESPSGGSSQAGSPRDGASSVEDPDSAKGSLEAVVSRPQLDPDAVNDEGYVVLAESSPGTVAGGATPQSERATEARLVTSSGGGTPDSEREADVQRNHSEGASGAPTLAAGAASGASGRGDFREADQNQLPPEANVASEAERNQKIAADWPMPQVVIYVSGQQHGYIEPCGCTGLEKQKGGLIRRDTLLDGLRRRGWEVVPVDVGNQVRRIGRQSEIKFQTTVDALKMMGYRAATLGIDDLQLSSIELIQVASSDELNSGEFVTANVSIIDPSFFPSYRIVEAGGRKIGITGILGAEFQDKLQSADVQVFDPVEKLKPVVQELESQGCDFLVLLAHASLKESASIAQQVPGLDLVVTAGGYGEPTLHPEKIDGSKAVMVQVGVKGMYGGIVGLFDDEETPIRYQKIAISSQFKDSPRMLERFAEYQSRLGDVGFDGLGITPISHPTGRKYVGSATCGECHTTAYDIWLNSPHVRATEDIIAADNDRGGIPRHHDPECISCHATGWNPQEFYPYETGFISPELTDHLMGSGCENCHGPGKDHVDAEYGDLDVDNETLLKFRQQMVLKLEESRDRCLECHDLDNSPDFHSEGAFDKYWEQVKHYGKD